VSEFNCRPLDTVIADTVFGSCCVFTDAEIFFFWSARAYDISRVLLLK